MRGVERLLNGEKVRQVVSEAETESSLPKMTPDKAKKLMKTVADAIDLDPNDVSGEPKITEHNGRYKIQSELVGDTGPAKLLFDKLYLVCEIIRAKEIEGSSNTILGKVDYYYTHPKGGSNGITIGKVGISDDLSQAFYIR